MASVMEKPRQRVINVSSISAGGSVSADVDCRYFTKLSVSIKVTYSSSATDGVRVYLLASWDGSNFDSENVNDAFAFFEPSFSAGATRQKTINVDALPRFIRILVRNLDSSHATGHVEVWVTWIP